MIGHRKRFIFIHIPKTAGTSLTNILARYGTVLQRERNQKSIYFKHAIARDLKPMLGDEYDRYFKFTFVRNPWDWVISNYEHNRGMHQPIIRGTQYRTATFERLPDDLKRMPFGEWLDWWLETFRPEQLQAIEGEEGELLVDEVYYFEDLPQEIKRLKKRLGVRQRGKLPHKYSNSHRRGKLADYYDQRMKEKVRSFMERDIRAFGYEFPE